LTKKITGGEKMKKEEIEVKISKKKSRHEPLCAVRAVCC
jgi:hypothetical protein